jgi:uncharacterized membrane protein
MPAGLISLLVFVGIFLAILTGSLAGTFIWRNRLIQLMRQYYPEELDVAMTSPDVSSAFGKSIPSSSRLLKVLNSAIPSSLQFAEVRATALRLKISMNALICCTLILIALALVGRFLPHS